MSQSISVPADGNLAVRFVTTIADSANPTAAEINAGTSVDLSCYITGDGLKTGTDEQTVTDPRLCSTQVFEQPGRHTDSIELTYVYNILSAGDDLARLALPKGTTGYIVARWGVLYSQAFAAGDIVDVWRIKAGTQQKQPPTANGLLTMMQKMFVTGETQRDVVVA